jgi:hypothetical protein
LAIGQFVDSSTGKADSREGEEAIGWVGRIVEALV